MQRDVKEAYAWLARNYEPDAEIYVIGFSRGAYAARSLCGLLDYSGLSASPASEKEAFSAYKTRTPHFSRGFVLSKTPFQIKRLYCFDTVGRLGVPGVGAFFHGFHNTSLSPLVEKAMHAVSIHETRKSFTPTLFTPCSQVTEKWFLGSHGDVGGGTTSTLSNYPLIWVCADLKKCGVPVKETSFKWLSFSPDAQISKPEGLWLRKARRTPPPNATSHVSVCFRKKLDGVFRKAFCSVS